MMRLALFSLILCAFAIGLSEQNFFKCFRFSNQLSREQREIKELSRYVKSGEKTGKDLFSLISELASKNIHNGFANRLKNLNPNTCDEDVKDSFEFALETIEHRVNQCNIKKHADYLYDVLLDYYRRAEIVCHDEKQKKLAAEAEEREFKRLELEQLKSETAKIEKLRRSEFGKRKRRELDELCTYLDLLGPNPSLESQLQLIFSKGAGDTLAALPRKLILDNCDPAGIRAAKEAQKELTRIERIAPHQVERLHRILDDYRQEMFKSCLDQYGKEWQGKIADLAESLASRLSAMFERTSLANDDQASLEAANRAIAELTQEFNANPRGAQDLIDVLRSYKEQILEVQLGRCSMRWAAFYQRLRLKLGQKGMTTIGHLTKFIRDLSPMSVRKDMGMLFAADALYDTEVLPKSPKIAPQKVARFYRPCEDLIRHEESVGVLESFYALAVEFDPQVLKSAIGTLDGDRSKLVMWVGRWRVCQWLVDSHQRP